MNDFDSNPNSARKLLKTTENYQKLLEPPPPKQKKNTLLSSLVFLILMVIAGGGPATGCDGDWKTHAVQGGPKMTERYHGSPLWTLPVRLRRGLRAYLLYPSCS